MADREPKRLQLGKQVTLDVLTTKAMTDEGQEMLCVSVICNTPWGPLRNIFTVESRTLRSMLVWLRSKYGMMAYDFVATHSQLHETVPRGEAAKDGLPASRRQP